jgi:hypothetical protein
MKKNRPAPRRKREIVGTVIETARVEEEVPRVVVWASDVAICGFIEEDEVPLGEEEEVLP